MAANKGCFQFEYAAVRLADALYRPCSSTALSSQSACCRARQWSFATLLVMQVRELLHKRIRDMYIHPQFTTDVMKPLRMEMLMDQEVKNLSGGELQRVAITLALGTPADVYLIDEPSAYLDSEQRIIAAKVGGWGAGGGLTLARGSSSHAWDAVVLAASHGKQRTFWVAWEAVLLLCTG